MVIDKNTGQVVAQGDAPAAFMWHSMNAYEQGDSIVADFVGYDEPDHFIGADPYFERIMRGEPGRFHAAGNAAALPYPAFLRAGGRDHRRRWTF